MAIRMSKDHQYKTSRDYQRLYRLLRETVVVCIVDYLDCRDVAATLFFADGANIGARGITYITAFDEDQFVEQCARYNVEFTEPNESA